MEKNSNELTNVNESSIIRFLKKISNFFKGNKRIIENNDELIMDKINKKGNVTNDFKSKLSGEYNEIQRLEKIREQYEKNEEYINQITTKDLIKLTEMNNREICDIENQIKREKSAV